MRTRLSPSPSFLPIFFPLSSLTFLFSLLSLCLLPPMRARARVCVVHTSYINTKKKRLKKDRTCSFCPRIHPSWPDYHSSDINFDCLRRASHAYARTYAWMNERLWSKYLRLNCEKLSVTFSYNVFDTCERIRNIVIEKNDTKANV